MTWNDWIAKASKIIPKNEAITILLSNFYNEKKNENWLNKHGQETIHEVEIEEIIWNADNDVKLRANGMPIAYITGIANFYGRDFWLGNNKERVLIPRPETEQIIDEVLKICGKPILPGVKLSKNESDLNHPTILDVGTGSGCIAITLALELPNAKIIACDISENALYVARENAWSLGIKVKNHSDYDTARMDLQKNKGGYINTINFQKSNLLTNIQNSPDIIVANLPYVDKNWSWLDKTALSYEPSIALYAEDGGLKLIKELIDTATSKYLILECDPCQHDEVIKYAKKKYEIININGYVLSLKRTKNNISTNHIKFPI